MKITMMFSGEDDMHNFREAFNTIYDHGEAEDMYGKIRSYMKHEEQSLDRAEELLQEAYAYFARKTYNEELVAVKHKLNWYRRIRKWISRACSKSTNQ